MISRKARNKYEQVQSTEEAKDSLGNARTDVEEGKINSKSEELILKIKSPDDIIHEISIAEDTTLKQLKDKILELTNIEPDRQRLIHFGKMLNQKPDESVVSTFVKTGDFVHLVPLPKNVTASSVNQTPGGAGREDSVDIGLDGVNLDELMNLSSFDYFGRVELSLFRARLRLLSSLMLFYYFLQAMGNISIWIHPEELDQRFEPGHHPSNLFFSLDLVEAVLGVSAALAAMKAANSDDPTFSLQLLRTLIELCLVHFVAFSMYYKELMDGKIQLRPQFTYGDHQQDNSDDSLSSDEVVASVMFGFGVNVVVWWTIVTIAAKYHRSLIALQAAEREDVVVTNSSDALDQVV